MAWTAAAEAVAKGSHLKTALGEMAGESGKLLADVVHLTELP